MSSSRCPGLDTLSASCESGRTRWIELLTIFWVNWRDGGEWMGQRKSGRWHLATITALWPRLVKCCVGHMNNKPTAESLWLAGDVLHSHHPSQAGDHWREFIYLLKLGAEHHENTAVHFNTMTGFQPSIKYQKRKILFACYVTIPQWKRLRVVFVSLEANVPEDAVLRGLCLCRNGTSITAQLQLWAIIILLRDTWLSFVALGCTHTITHNKLRCSCPPRTDTHWKKNATSKNRE